MTRHHRRYGSEHDSTMIEDHGVVVRIYPDDNEGSRHQRFVIRLNTGQTLLIAHNIDLVERVPIMLEDYIEFRGEYEFNEKGGLVHWTHHDPMGELEGGWIKHAGFVYA